MNRNPAATQNKIDPKPKPKHTPRFCLRRSGEPVQQGRIQCMKLSRPGCGPRKQGQTVSANFCRSSPVSFPQCLVRCPHFLVCCLKFLGWRSRLGWLSAQWDEAASWGRSGGSSYHESF